VHSFKGEGTVEVLGEPKTIADGLGENRTIVLKDGIFKDSFRAWDMHLYRIYEKNAD
jgi:hypothetical protein